MVAPQQAPVSSPVTEMDLSELDADPMWLSRLIKQSLPHMSRKQAAQLRRQYRAAYERADSQHFHRAWTANALQTLDYLLN